MPNSELKYIGETGRKFSTRLSELVRVMNKRHIGIYVTTLHAEDSLSPSQRQSRKGKYLWCCVRDPMPNSELKYIGETGRKFSTRLSEHQKDSKNEPQVNIRVQLFKASLA